MYIQSQAMDAHMPGKGGAKERCGASGSGDIGDDDDDDDDDDGDGDDNGSGE